MVVNLPLGGLRAIASAFLPDAAVIARYTETNTPDGVTQSWTTIASDVPCRVSQPSTAAGVERAEEGGQLRAVSSWRIWLPFDTDITERDRITVSGSDRTDNRTFEVARVDEKTYESSRRCFCFLLT